MLTEDGRKVLRGEAPFALREDVADARRHAARKLARRRPRDADADLLAALKALRAAIAQGARPAGLCDLPRPHADRDGEGAGRRTWRELADIHGVGEQKLQKYGPAFLAVMKSHADA